MSARTRILVVDDSAMHRQAILDVLAKYPEFEVVGIATTGEEAIKQVILRTPDLITLDLEMPKMDGFTFLRWLMSAKPTRTIVVSSKESHRSVFRAMELGAMDFVVKPLRQDALRMGELEHELVRKMKAAILGDLAKVTSRILRAEGPPVPLKPRGERSCRQDIHGILIASSTGGPPALQAILQVLPENFPIPIFIAQHMPVGFTALFAKRLAGLVKVPVKEAAEGEIAERGIFIAPGGAHLVLEKKAGRITNRVLTAQPGDRYVPSADRLFATGAEVFHSYCAGVVLTGMGEDGVIGLSSVKREGGYIIAEHESTSIVYGMPRAVVERGLADSVTPLHEIAGLLIGMAEEGH